MEQKNKIILTEQNIIDTYDEYQREQTKLYFQYKKIKEENPTFGYKRISKLLNQPYSKTRWWYEGKYTPFPIQTVNWLKEKNLIPLTVENQNLPLLSRILGTMFGDGGIDINLNMICLSSSETKALEDFKQDLISIFGKEIEKNFSIINTGINKTAYCIRNTNRNIIRFFKALGTPIGNKTTQKLFIPGWIKINKDIEDQFYFSFFGSEVGIPKQRGGQANTFDIVIGGRPEYETNRLEFLNEIRKYLTDKEINTGKISINRSMSGINQKAHIYRLLMSTNITNMITFYKKVKLNYCYYKTEKLKNTIIEIMMIKSERCRELQNMYGWDKLKALKRLGVGNTNILDFEL